MTHKFQYSKKFADGGIFVVGADTYEEFEKNLDQADEFFAQLEEANAGTMPLTDNAGNAPFEVENIKLASGGEHPRWVVQGGNFTKFGVTCWPETLEKAGLLEHMKVDADNKPKKRWMAHYSTKEDGKPDKVILLEPA